MRCPTLSELPPSPPGKTGWPWTEETPPLPQTMPDGQPWLRISIVTPSFNQGEFIEETIRSVLLQGYPNLEYIIIDGGSTDDSVKIIRKYEPWLTHWVSERDKGQAHAINKGLDVVTGDIFNWINSDDMLTPNVMSLIASTFYQTDAVCGACINFSEDGNETIFINKSLSSVSLLKGGKDVIFHQPAIWLKLNGVAACGGIDNNLQYVFDWDLCLRYFYLYRRITYIPNILARFRLHDNSKTVSRLHKFQEEKIQVVKNLMSDSNYSFLHKACDKYIRLNLWYNELGLMLNNKQINNWNRALILIKASCLDPRVRWSRPTLGALRRCFL